MSKEACSTIKALFTDEPKLVAGYDEFWKEAKERGAETYAPESLLTIK
jgi:hypothetical protein